MFYKVALFFFDCFVWIPMEPMILVLYCNEPKEIGTLNNAQLLCYCVNSNTFGLGINVCLDLIHLEGVMWMLWIFIKLMLPSPHQAVIYIRSRGFAWNWVCNLDYDKFDPALEKAVLFSVGNTLVCDNLDEAKRLSWTGERCKGILSYVLLLFLYVICWTSVGFNPSYFLSCNYGWNSPYRSWYYDWRHNWWNGGKVEQMGR